jgi:hypothetical protein
MHIPELTRPPETEVEIRQALHDTLGDAYVFDDYDEVWVAVDENYRGPGRCYVWVTADWCFGRTVVAPEQVQ